MAKRNPTEEAVWNSISNTDEQDAMLHIQQMLQGTQMMQTEPGVVYSLAVAKANPADAQSIDQFLQEQDAEKQVTIARQSIAGGHGGYIDLSPQQQELLNQTGFKYDDVLATSKGAADFASQQITDLSGGKLTVKKNADGTLATDANGHLITEAVPQKQSGGGGWFDSIGGFFGHLGGALKSGGEDVLSGMNKAWNFVSTGLTQGVEQGAYMLTHGTFQPNMQQVLNNAADMQAQGYDPTSFWSTAAYNASGKARIDTTSLRDKYGDSAVDDALKYLDNPKAYRENVLSDPASYQTGPDGQLVLTPTAQQFVGKIQSKSFTDLVQKLNANDATPGNAIANAAGLDPIKHPDLYMATTAGLNLAASFAIDPTNAAFMGLKALKTAQLTVRTVDGLNDADKAASILTRTSHLPWVNSVQRGWQQGIDLGQQIREATLAGDTAKAGQLSAQFSSQLPGLRSIMDQFIGLHAFTGYEETTVNGAKKLIPVFRDTGGIKSLGDPEKGLTAADFIKSQWGMQRLMVGKAAVQSSLMPGSLSAFGFRKLKGLTAGWQSSRAASTMGKKYAAAVSFAEANAPFAQKWLDEGYLTRVQPEADDAINAEGLLAQPAQSAQEGLASAQRGQLALTPAGMGVAARNVRLKGDPTGIASKFGWASGPAIAARLRVAATRLSTLMPRNTVIDLTDPQSGEKIAKWARLYMDKGTASQYEAAWNAASMGQRKVMLDGLYDQLAHTAGLTKSESGTALYNRYKTALENYSASGNDVVLNGRKVALADGQTTTVFRLPSFDEIYREASKVGLWDATFGRALTSKYADLLGGQWKWLALAYPKTWTRNWLEGGLRTALEGEAGDAIKARALLTTPNAELWKRGYGLEDLELYKAQRGIAESTKSLLKSKDLTAEQRAAANDKLAEAQRLMGTVTDKPSVMHLLATESGDTKLAKQIEQGSMLSGDLLGRSKPADWLAHTAAMSLVGRAYRSLVGKTMNDTDIDMLMKMSPDDMGMLLQGYHQQMLEDMGFQNARKSSSESAKVGFGSATLKYAIKHNKARNEGELQALQKSWTLQALDDTLGADRYSNALGRLITGSPETARNVVKALLISDENTSEKADALKAVIGSLEKESKYTDFGKAYFPDPLNAPSQARRAVNAEEVAAGKADWANKLIGEFRYLLTGQNGKLNEDIANYILEHGEAPTGNWIAKMTKGAERPEAALAPETMPLPAGGFDKIVPALQGVEGGFFGWGVERMLQRTMSAPVLAANFIDARKALIPDVERLVGQGFSREASENLAQELAMKNAMIHTEQLIDDPGQRSQFDVIARNMFPFSRAVQAMVRRWVPGLWRNPAGARKLMLSYEAAQHAGIIYNNEYGEPTFTYPGSGAMAGFLSDIGQYLPGFQNIAAFPVSASMTGGAIMAVPGADNPFRMAMGPMISIPIREAYKHILPTAWQGEALKLDSLVNGPIGAGQTFSQLVPSPVRRFYQAFDTSTQNAGMTSAMNSALANLAAAGLVPNPQDAQTPSIMQQFRGRLQTQVKNQLVLRAVLGLFAPAPPSNPSEATPGSGADAAFQWEGLSQLSQEYKEILNETGGNVAEASAVFTAMHPDELVYKGTDKHPVWELPTSAYETPETQANASGAYLPSTTEALDWLTQNAGFVKQYSSVAAYFLPMASTNEPFNDAAYQAQLELGLRVRKSPDQFLSDVYVKHAEALFYPTVKKFDNLIATAKMQGDTATADAYTTAKSNWETEYKAINPAFGAKIDNYSGGRVNANAQLSDLRLMVQKGQVPDGWGTKLSQLLSTWDQYQAFKTEHPGNTTAERGYRSQAQNMLQAWADQELAGTPVAAIYNGVFRVLDTNLTKLPTGEGA